MRLELYAQHTAEELDLQLLNGDAAARFEVARTWLAQHDSKGASALVHWPGIAERF
jgi:hypothetical protein